MDKRRPRKRVGVVFGGRSGEHEVSLRSAAFVLESLDPEKYDVVPIGITREGEWLLGNDPLQHLTALQRGARHADRRVEHPTIPLQATETGWLGNLDIVFPVLHGPHGEDGTIQGILEMANFPYVGSGVTASAIAMDKGMTKAVLRDHGLPVGNCHTFLAQMWRDDPAEFRADVEERVTYPLFVKPCNLGSSVGISKVHNASEFDVALGSAAEFDRRVIVEQAVPNVREIEVGVLGNDQLAVSVCGEVIPAREFYDYQSKYEDDRSQVIVPADLPESLADQISAYAVQTFLALDAAGYARVDFLVDAETLEVFIGEINTIPGFTPISMFPQLWAASGLSARQLMDQLINLAVQRHRNRPGLMPVVR